MLIEGSAQSYQSIGRNVGQPGWNAQERKFCAIVQLGMVVNGTLSRGDAFPDVRLATEILDGKVSGTAGRAFESWLKTVQIGKYHALSPNTLAPNAAVYRYTFAKPTRNSGSKDRRTPYGLRYDVGPGDQARFGGDTERGPRISQSPAQ
jgi:hypothetical protein